MAIDDDQRARMELELAGYRSARFLGECAPWIFWDGNMERALEQGYFERVDNGSFKASYYYRPTPKGRAELKKAGRGFTYGDAEGRMTISYRQGDAWNTRRVKVSREKKRERAEGLLAAFHGLVTDEGAHDRLALEKEGWFPSKTTEPYFSLVEDGLVERTELGFERAISYYRLTEKGKATLLVASGQKLEVRQAVEREKFERELVERRQKLEADAIAEKAKLLRRQASERRSLPDTIDVRAWRHLPGWQD
jgi:DNA-binding PadR family transcriptional regulator